MSGIIGSRLNNRGSGLVGSLGTDGQVFTSSGAGVGATYEAAAGGGKVLQVVGNTNTSYVGNATVTYASTGLEQAITPSSTDSDIIILLSASMGVFNNLGAGVCQAETALYRDIGGGGYSVIEDYLISLGYYGGAEGCATYGGLAVSTIDSPSTTSAVTYRLYQSVYLTTTSAVDINPYSNKSSIVLFEIDGS